jgi:hypothetical protein
MSFLRQASNAVPRSRSWGDDVPKHNQKSFKANFPQEVYLEMLYKAQSMLLGYSKQRELREFKRISSLI